MLCDIRFPNLGIVLKSVNDGFTIFGFEIKYYGVVIALGFLLGYFVATREAKRTGQNPELYLDYLICLIVPAIVGARLYYVIFSWDMYKDDLLSIVNVRNGGLGIYGGVIAGVITLFVLAKKRKVNFWLMTDTCAMSLLIGQIIGRWGNFFNREAFGGYTDSLFAMAIPVNEASYTTNDVLSHTVLINGIEYIQVHPAFLYEGLWNLLLLIVIFTYRKHKKFNGELTAIYFFGYGLGRFVIEGLRTDQLILCKIGSTPIPVSQVVAVILMAVSLYAMIHCRLKLKKNPELAYVNLTNEADNKKKEQSK